MRTLVMKFGGAAVATIDHFSRIADIIVSRKNEFDRLVVVVSAMGNTTDQLIAMAKQVNPDPPRREYDMLITVGERMSSSLLSMSLALKNCEAISFTGSQAGIITCSNHTDAKIVDVRPMRILPLLNLGKVIVVAGFQGVSRLGEITTLGRGGSDTTAVALGVAFRAEQVEFYKDVQGVYSADPKKNPEAVFYEKLEYKEALDIVSQGGRILHPRCISLAMKNHLPLKVRSFNSFGQNEVASLVYTEGERPSQPLFESA
jgi:aspartate kinase